MRNVPPCFCDIAGDGRARARAVIAIAPLSSIRGGEAIVSSWLFLDLEGTAPPWPAPSLTGSRAREERRRMNFLATRRARALGLLWRHHRGPRAPRSCHGLYRRDDVCFGVIAAALDEQTGP